MSRLLKWFEGPPRSLADVADMLERHIGDGADEECCKETVAVLRKVRNRNPTYYLHAALRELDKSPSACQAVRNVIRVLRKWRHYSGT